MDPRVPWSAPWVALWAHVIATGRSSCDAIERLLPLDTPEAAPAPDRMRDWATPYELLFSLPTLRLLRFTGAAPGPTAVLVAPYALHAATTADLAPGHSVIGALLAGGIGRVLLTDWRSAAPADGRIGIDACLADLNVVVDEAGPPAALAGLCQGGWLAAVYAARFPAKVSRLAIAGAPLDVDAAPSALRHLVRDTAAATIAEMIALGHGVMRGRMTQATWPTPEPDAREIARTLQVRKADEELTKRFLSWNDDVIDLPGAFYAETSERIFRGNLLAQGACPALGRTVGLRDIVCPVQLLAARDDAIVAPAQTLALAEAHRAPEQVTTCLVDGPHLSLFMGQTTLHREWIRIAAFLGTGATARARPARVQQART
jgi:poly(3-hydroxyalkanoate) synthetase